MADGLDGAAKPTQPDGLKRFVVEQDGAYFLRQVLDGDETLIPLDVATAGLQKLGTADKRLKEASETAKRHKTAIAFYDNTVRGLNGDQDAALQALEMVGLNDEPAAPPARAPQRGDPNGSPAAYNIPPELADVAKFLNDVKGYGVDPAQAVRMVIGQAQQQVEHGVFAEVGSLAKQDPVLSKILKNPKHARYVVDELNGLVRSRIRNGEPDGPQTYLPAIREVAAKYKELGIGVAPAPIQVQTDENGERLISSYGLGPASSTGAGEAGLTPPDKRPDATTPLRAHPGEYARNFASRLAYDLTQGRTAAAEAALGDAD